jgi:hypothetical protein
MAETWFTAQFRCRETTHTYLKDQARAAGISVTQAAGVILDAACREGWQIGPVIVTRQPSRVVTRLNEPQEQAPRS